MTLPLSIKESIVLKALNREPGISLTSIAKSNNIGISTLSRWLQQSSNNNLKPKSSVNSREQWLTHLLNTKNLSDVSLGKYCRQHGIYSHQLTEWKKELMSVKATDNKEQKKEVNELKDEVKRLERELARKDKALAEASALLILKKKANLIWGDNGDDS